MTNEQLDALAMVVQQVVLARDAVGRPVTRFHAAEIAAQLLNEQFTNAELLQVAQRSATITKADIARILGEEEEQY